MKQLIATSSTVLAFSLYILFGTPDAPAAQATPAVALNTPSKNIAKPVAVAAQKPKTTTPTSKPTPTPTPVLAPKPTPKPTGQYRDGSYTGPVADAYYGNVQIRATVSGGKLTDVAFLQYPNDRGTSRAINGQAMPYLIQEAIQAQAANVDIVSGATDTSIAFQQSLGAALAQAKG